MLRASIRIFFLQVIMIIDARTTPPPPIGILSRNSRTFRMKSQVRASPLETFVALVGAPRNAMSSVISGIIPVQSMDDHSDVVRMCARPAWLKLAWAAPRDFCLARYMEAFCGVERGARCTYLSGFSVVGLTATTPDSTVYGRLKSAQVAIMISPGNFSRCR